MNLIKNIKEIAKKVLLNEAQAIEKSIEFVDQNFEECVKVILASGGRVVVTGIGKSANIAKKIVATFNSTGTPALFMHAGDAIHGDLGMVQSSDVVVCLSKSGNTAEIKVLVPLIRRLGNPLIALVSSVDSYLASQADFVLNASIESEACPHDLAPTTSSTVQLALGDALAVCLLEARGFTSEDFARYHPGGSLGKQLYLKVDDIYPSNNCPKVLVDAPLKEVLLVISSGRLGAAAVVDTEQKLQGIITDGDLRRMLKDNASIDALNANDVMTASPKTIPSGSFAAKALQVMQQGNITQLIVVDGTAVLGFVHLHDLLREGII
ncbi:MAG: KpsF/GutQ family sugar-phosphate isomerase [Cyclobacteriaceae bacterium]